jgi:serine/threonine-protein kinase
VLKSDTNEATTLVNSEAEPEQAKPLPVGFVVGGKYAIKRLLGMGGNGAVYEGEHNTVGHRVAIKVAHRALAERQDIIARFRREARICGTLRHPHVGQVYDFGSLDDGSPYMVMELQDGRSLADVLLESRLPIAAIIHIARQLLDGLGAAHRFGAIHRDVKPDNVMIVRDQSGEVIVKLVDFGISKSIDQQADHGGTLEGVIVGSPDYMSPEQLRGEDVDPRTDLYSTGVLLYEAVTGRLPFEHEKIVDVVTAIMRDPFPRPAELRRDCPPELENAILKAMSRDVSTRYQSAEEMSRALAECQGALRAGSGVNLVYLSARPGRSTERDKSQRRRTLDSATLSAIQTQIAGFGKRPRLLWFGVAAILVSSVVAVATWRMSDPVPRSERSTPKAARGSSRHTVKREPATAPPIVAAQAAGAGSVPVAARQEGPPSANEMQPSSSEAESNPNRIRLPRKAAGREPAGDEARARRRATASENPPNTAKLDAAALNAKLKQAATAFALGQIEGARGVYLEIVAASPSQAEAWRGLGLAASRLGDHVQAARAFKRYLALRPTAVDAERIRQQLDKVQ